MRSPECSKLAKNPKKWQWRHNFPTWRRNVNVKFFWRFFLFLVKFSCWSKFHVNIITDSGIITIFFITPVWVLPNIWRLGQVMDKFGTNVSNKILLNAAKFQGYSSYCFWVIKGKPTGGRKITLPPSPTRLALKILQQMLQDFQSVSDYFTTLRSKGLSLAKYH